MFLSEYGVSEAHCPRCGFDGYPKIVTPGSFAIEVVLWLFFLLPGLIYSIWRLSARHKACPKCGEKSPIPIEMHRRSQAPLNLNPATAEKPKLSVLEKERILSQQESDRKECLERAQALEERYKQTKDETLVPRIQTLRTAADAASPAPESVPQPTQSAKVLEQSRLQKEIQAKWERRSPEDLLREAKSLVEEYKRSHDDSLLPRVEALRRTASERAKSPQSKGVITTTAKRNTSWSPLMRWGLAIAGVILLLGIIGVFTNPGREVNPPTSKNDSAGELIASCGPPSLDDSTENDEPRPPIPSRIIEYRQYNLRFLFTSTKLGGGPPPYEWMLVGITDLQTDEAVTVDEARKRMPCWVKH